MPRLAEIYGLMPWHFGGDEALTYIEAEEFFEDLRAKQRDAQRQERKHPTPRRRR